MLVRDATCDTHIGQGPVERQFWKIVLADQQLREFEGLDDPAGTCRSLLFRPIVTGLAVAEPAPAKTAMNSSRFRAGCRSRPPEQPMAEQRAPPYNLSLNLSIPPCSGMGPLRRGAPCLILSIFKARTPRCCLVAGEGR